MPLVFVHYVLDDELEWFGGKHATGHSARRLGLSLCLGMVTASQRTAARSRSTAPTTEPLDITSRQFCNQPMDAGQSIT